MVLSLLWLVERYLRWVTTSFVVTNQRLILRKGILRRSGREIMLDRLSDITYKQTLSDRLLRCGDILIESAGREGARGPGRRASPHQDPERDIPPGQPTSERASAGRRLGGPGALRGQPVQRRHPRSRLQW